MIHIFQPPGVINHLIYFIGRINSRRIRKVVSYPPRLTKGYCSPTKTKKTNLAEAVTSTCMIHDPWFLTPECPDNSNRLVPFRRRSTYPRLSCVVFARVLKPPGFAFSLPSYEWTNPREGAADMWRARPITPAISGPLSSHPWKRCRLILALRSQAAPSPFAIASFSRPRPVAMELVDLQTNVHRLLGPTIPCSRPRRLCTLQDGRPGKCSVRESALSVLAMGLDPINGGYSDYGQSPAHRTRTLFWSCKGGRGIGYGCVELKLKPSELGPKAMNCTFWLLLPAPCATPLSVPVKRHRALHLQL